jgi:hypothetical protein
MASCRAISGLAFIGLLRTALPGLQERTKGRAPVPVGSLSLATALPLRNTLDVDRIKRQYSRASDALATLIWAIRLSPSLRPSSHIAPSGYIVFPAFRLPLSPAA